MWDKKDSGYITPTGAKGKLPRAEECTGNVLGHCQVKLKPCSNLEYSLVFSSFVSLSQMMTSHLKAVFFHSGGTAVSLFSCSLNFSFPSVFQFLTTFFCSMDSTEIQCYKQSLVNVFTLWSINSIIQFWQPPAHDYYCLSTLYLPSANEPSENRFVSEFKDASWMGADLYSNLFYPIGVIGDHPLPPNLSWILLKYIW